LGDCLLWAVFFEKYRSSPHFWSTFFHVSCSTFMHFNFGQKIVCPHFLAILTQVHLVTLASIVTG
jgi:hypothetical protein